MKKTLGKKDFKTKLKNLNAEFKALDEAYPKMVADVEAKRASTTKKWFEEQSTIEGNIITPEEEADFEKVVKMMNPMPDIVKAKKSITPQWYHNLQEIIRGLDLEEEYALIQSKKSTLSRNLRDYISMLHEA